MTRTVLIAAVVVASLLAGAPPVSAKAAISAATIIGPGVPTGLRIAAPATEGLWQTGIGVTGGLDSARAGSVAELGLDPADLGPRYLVLYVFFGDGLVRQYLYPYAPGGPVSFTPPGQALSGLIDDFAMPIISGWHQGPPPLLDYLVERGFPERPADGAALGAVARSHSALTMR